MFQSTTRPSSGKTLKVITEGILTNKLTTSTKYADITHNKISKLKCLKYVNTRWFKYDRD